MRVTRIIALGARAKNRHVPGCPTLSRHSSQCVKTDCQMRRRQAPRPSLRRFNAAASTTSSSMRKPSDRATLKFTRTVKYLGYCGGGMASPAVAPTRFSGFCGGTDDRFTQHQGVDGLEARHLRARTDTERRAHQAFRLAHRMTEQSAQPMGALQPNDAAPR